MKGAWCVTAGHDVFFSVFDLNLPPFNFDFDPDENFGRQLNNLFSKYLFKLNLIKIKDGRWSFSMRREALDVRLGETGTVLL